MARAALDKQVAQHDHHVHPRVCARSGVSQTGRTLTDQIFASVQVKPDGVQRALVGEVISRFEKKGFTLKGLKMFIPSKELAEEHYKDLSSKPFFKDLVSYITSGPVVAMVRLLFSPALSHFCKSLRVIPGTTLSTDDPQIAFERAQPTNFIPLVSH